MRKALPNARIRLIERTRLLRMLAEWRSLRLIRVTAPAGFGKTTLAAMWLQRLGDEPIVAWVTLDAEDDSPDVLLQHIEESLQPGLPALAAISALERAGRMTAEQTVRQLCAEAATAGREIIVVLDDCHLLRAADAHAVLQHLFDFAPPNLHLVLLSRESASLDVGRSRLLDITAAEMSLDHEEFTAFVPGSAIEGLGAEDLAAVERRAEGWIAGLQMLAMTRHAGAPPSDVLWQSGIVAEFIEHEVFLRLRPDLRALLIDTALLPWLTSESTAAVSGLDEAYCARLLFTIADANAFVIPLAASTAVYRVHPLFREFLLRRLQEERTAEQQRALRLRAAAWLGAHGEVDTALTLLQPIGAWAEAAAIVAAVSRSAILRMDLSSLRRWLARLPAEIVAGTPQLAVDAAWAAFLSDAADMRTPVTRAQQTLAVAAAGVDGDELRAELCVVETVCDLAEGDMGAAHRALQRTAQIPHAPVGLAAGYLHFLNSCVPVDPLDLDGRMQMNLFSERIFQSIGFDYGCIEASTSRGLIKRLCGDMQGALVDLQHAASVIHRSGWGHSLSTFDCHYSCAEVLYEMNRIAEVREELQHAIHANRFNDSAAATVHLARLLLELCDGVDSDSGFVPTDDDAVWAEIVATINPIIVAHVGWLRIRRDLCARRTARCWHTVETMHVLPADLRSEMPDLLWIAVLTGALAHRRQLPLLGRLLPEFRRRMEDIRNHWMLLRVRAMQVVHHLYVDDAAAAEAELHALLPRIEESGMLRVVLDWPPLEPLLARSRSPFAQRLRGMFKHVAAEAIPFGLSAQEFRILQHLVEGLSTAAIAERIFVETTTLRRYMTRVYRKMGVHSRAEAVQAARAAGVR
jgi:LuxR family maltose regulon positive regulatory protein